MVEGPQVDAGGRAKPLLFPRWLPGLGEAQERSREAILSSSHEGGPADVAGVSYSLGTARGASGEQRNFFYVS